MILYELRAGDPDADPARIHAHGVFQQREEAEAELASLRDRIESAPPKPASGCRNKAYWLHEIDTSQFGQVPPSPAPRQLFWQSHQPKPTKPGCWDHTDVQVRKGPPDGGEVVASYVRSYPGVPPFEPFRQNGEFYALISPRYTGTSVLDLQTGEIVAEEPESSWGFCPVGFYVPDWWDVHDGSITPGSLYWRDWEGRFPAGDFGFVWGCVWGDDSIAWKVQYLDLSRISQGAISREERFGYLYLDDIGDDPREFIRVSAPTSPGGAPKVEFSVPQLFNLRTGAKEGYDD